MAKELIEGSKIIFDQRGGSKGAVSEEQPTIDFAFATVVSIKKITKGEIFSKDNIWVKRPGTGEILAEEYESLIGKTSTRDIEVDEHIFYSDIK